MIIFFLIRHDFIKTPFQSNETKKWKKISRVFVFVTRTIMALLILIALASPFVIKDKILDREPFIKILIDNSTSFRLFDQEVIGPLTSELEKNIDVEVRTLASGEKSAIADGILQNLKTDENILLITDGVNNHGSDLADVVLFAKNLNATINTLSVEPIRTDISVTIEGATQTMTDVENDFSVKVNKVGEIASYHLTVRVDGKALFDDSTNREQFDFKQKFKNGFHEITAEVSLEDDYFSENNIYYKTVKVVPKPKILFYSKRSFPLYSFLLDLYDVDKVSAIPEDLSDYYMVIVNNIPAEELFNPEGLVDFLTEGNGLVIFGGDNAYDLGGYKDSLFESILPVFVAQPGKQEGEKNILLVIDISGGFREQRSSSKAIAASVFRDIANNVKIGAMAFGENKYQISPLKYKFENQDLENKISRLNIVEGGEQDTAGAMYSAISILSRAAGSKSIIIITDGEPESDMGGPMNAAAQLAKKQGIKIYPIGIGQRVAEGRLRLWADVTGGTYFVVDQSARLKLLFGNPEDAIDTPQKALKILDSYHFITQDLEPKALITGFNQVVPKTIARLLATTNAGDPLVTVWHYGLGRVGSISTDDGTFWAGDLLRIDNSKLLTRTFNWAIGSPDRKSKDFVNIKDTRIKTPTELSIRTDTLPVSDQVVFYKSEKDLYKAELTPITNGFHTVLGATYASNYPLEYDRLGFNKDLLAISESTGGKVFAAQQIDEIVEHVRSRSKKVISAKVDQRWLFILVAVLLFLIEITIRRIIDHKKIYKGN